MKSLMASVMEGFSSLRAKTQAVMALKSTSVCAGSMKRSLDLRNIEQALLHTTVGSHLITARKFYIHHGIYLGAGRVAHYAGYSGSFTPGPIEVTDLEQFANGRPVWIIEEQSEYSSDEIVRRAYSRIGERHYRIFSNNCEHFCSWCTHGKSQSAQVELLLHSPRGFFSMISALESRLTA